MIKQIMLATALSLTQPIADNAYYDLYNDYGVLTLNFSNYDTQDYNALIINLDNGVTEAVNLIYNSTEDYYEIDYSEIWFSAQVQHLSDYIQWLFYDSQSSIGFDWNGFSIDLPFTAVAYNLPWSEIYIDCFIAVPTQLDNVIENVSDFCEFQIDLDTGRTSFLNNEWVNPATFIQIDTSYLVIKTNEIFDGNGYQILPSRLQLFYNYTDIGIYNNEVDIYGSYTDFIYGNITDLVNINEELTRENEELTRENEELFRENEMLNSKHALSNVFEIIRGAFDGIINFLETEITPNITIGTIMFIPVVIGVIFFILKALVL